MRLRMKRTIYGSVNGRDVRTYEEGQEYELPEGPESLAEVFVRESWAEEVGADEAESTNESEGEAAQKSIGAAPRNKARTSAQNKAENKAEDTVDAESARVAPTGID